MSNFIDKVDYQYHLRTYRLDQILDDDNIGDPEEILNDAEDEAVQEVKDALYGKYDINKIFNQVGAGRNKSVLRWCKVLTIAMIYERIPDELIPAQVLENAKEVRKILSAVADGKRSVDLPVLEQVNEDGSTSTVTKLRWGSRPARSH